MTNTFDWIQIRVCDKERAAAFHAALVGWQRAGTLAAGRRSRNRGLTNDDTEDRGGGTEDLRDSLRVAPCLLCDALCSRYDGRSQKDAKGGDVNQTQTYESYPAWIVLVSNLASGSIYVIGAYLLAKLSIWLLPPYLLYILWLEIRLLRTACVDCAYYGRACAFGRGRLCAMAFKHGDPQCFAERQISWAEMIPDLLVSVVPMVAGIVLMILYGWSWVIIGLLLMLLLLSTVGNGWVRGSLACQHCKQRELGCPACGLFGGRSDG